MAAHNGLAEGAVVGVAAARGRRARGDPTMAAIEEAADVSVVALGAEVVVGAVGVRGAAHDDAPEVRSSTWQQRAGTELAGSL